MSARTTHKTLAVVLHSLDYGESDRIVTFYTADFGKLKGIAKGARRSRRRFVNALEPFCCSQILFSRKSLEMLALIESCDVVHHYPKIRGDLEKTLIASSVIELVEAFTTEGKANDRLFETLQDFLRLLDEGKRREGLLPFFTMRLLKLTGYEPALDRCLHCKASIGGGEPYRFSPGRGGLLCRSCYGSASDAFPVSLGTIKTLLLGKDIAPEKIGRVVLSARSVLECEQILNRFVAYLLGKELKSVAVANEIRKMVL